MAGSSPAMTSVSAKSLPVAILRTAALEPRAKRYFARHSTIASNVELGTQLSSFLGAASATGFGKAMAASGCREACGREQPDKRTQTKTTKRIREIFRRPWQNPP